MVRRLPRARRRRLDPMRRCYRLHGRTRSSPGSATLLCTGPDWDAKRRRLGFVFGRLEMTACDRSGRGSPSCSSFRAPGLRRRARRSTTASRPPAQTCAGSCRRRSTRCTAERRSSPGTVDAEPGPGGWRVQSRIVVQAAAMVTGNASRRSKDAREGAGDRPLSRDRLRGAARPRRPLPVQGASTSPSR